MLGSGALADQQDAEGISALHWACAGGNTDCAKLLLDAAAYPNCMEADERHLTPLDYAILGDHHELAQLLIERGALTITSIQELAAVVIQKVVRGFIERRRVARIREKSWEGRRVEVSSLREGESVTTASEVVMEGRPESTDGSAAVRRR